MKSTNSTFLISRNSCRGEGRRCWNRLILKILNSVYLALPCHISIKINVSNRKKRQWCVLLCIAQYYWAIHSNTHHCRIGIDNKCFKKKQRKYFHCFTICLFDRAALIKPCVTPVTTTIRWGRQIGTCLFGFSMIWSLCKETITDMLRSCSKNDDVFYEQPLIELTYLLGQPLPLKDVVICIDDIFFNDATFCLRKRKLYRFQYPNIYLNI